jgi:membrane-bound lytic murein transglycosylase B
MIGSWAGGMGHTQWMPEVWLHVGIDMTMTARSRRSACRRCACIDGALFHRARQHRRRALGLRGAHAGEDEERRSRTYAAWQALGVTAPTAKLFRSRRRPHGQGAGAGRAGLPARAEFLRRAATIRR